LTAQSAPDEERDDETGSHGFADYTCDELLEQAQLNAQAALLATASFLQSRGIPLEEWGSALGKTFSAGWDDPRPWEAGEFLDALLTNLRSLGANVQSCELGYETAEAVITDFPRAELCEMFGFEPDLLHHYLIANVDMASARGIELDWKFERGRLRVGARRTAR
jgi:hypothetical protein